MVPYTLVFGTSALADPVFSPMLAKMGLGSFLMMYGAYVFHKAYRTLKGCSQ